MEKSGKMGQVKEKVLDLFSIRVNKIFKSSEKRTGKKSLNYFLLNESIIQVLI